MPPLCSLSMHKPPAEPALDAQVAERERILQRRRRLENLLVLDVETQRAADTAVRTDGVDGRLFPFVPLAGRARVELAFCHERARWTHRDAIPAIDTRRFRKLHRE